MAKTLEYFYVQSIYTAAKPWMVPVWPRLAAPLSGNKSHFIQEYF